MDPLTLPSTVMQLVLVEQQERSLCAFIFEHFCKHVSLKTWKITSKGKHSGKQVGRQEKQEYLMDVQV